MGPKDALSLLQGEDGRVQLPGGRNLRGPAVVFEVFKGEAHDCYRDRFWDLTAVGFSQIPAVLLQLRLEALARGAILRVHRSLHHDAGRILLRRSGDLEMKVAIAVLHCCPLQKCVVHLEEHGLASDAGTIRNTLMLRPGEDSLNCDGGCRPGRQRDVLLGVTEIYRTRLFRMAVAQIAKVVAAAGEECDECDKQSSQLDCNLLPTACEHSSPNLVDLKIG